MGIYRETTGQIGLSGYAMSSVAVFPEFDLVCVHPENEFN
jgi:hypothetical protein